jgi:hypothetical protein
MEVTREGEQGFVIVSEAPTAREARSRTIYVFLLILRLCPIFRLCLLTATKKRPVPNSYRNEILIVMQPITVPVRFCGPPDSGNGGYTCGLVASAMGGVVECTLRAPVPMEVPLHFARTDSGGVLRHGEKLIVEASPTTISVTPAEPVSVISATQAMTHSPALDPAHPFPTCFVCGPKRGIHDGLRIFPAPLKAQVFVSTWTPEVEFGEGDSGSGGKLLRPEFLWAALDCPTGFAAGFPTAGKLVTGRLAVQQLKSIRTGAICLLMSWPLGVEGRKHFSAACLYQNSDLCAVAKATWIKVAN